MVLWPELAVREFYDEDRSLISLLRRSRRRRRASRAYEDPGDSWLQLEEPRAHQFMESFNA